MATIDFEDISKKIFAYLREEVEFEVIGIKTRINGFILQKNLEKGDSLLKEIPDEEQRFRVEPIDREFPRLDNWIYLIMGEEVTLNSNFDAASKTYAIELSSMMRDNLTTDTFYRSVRMAEVLKNIMVCFFKETRDMGFASGEITSILMPEKVSLKGTNAIRSRVTYLITII